MKNEFDDFIEKQRLVQRLLGQYQQNVSLMLDKSGYKLEINNPDNYFILKPRKGGLISLLGMIKKIYYANIMPDCLDEIIPINNKPFTKEDIEKAESKLEKIAAEMSQPDIAGFAFESGISLNIVGDRFNYDEKEDSVHIPIAYFDSSEDLLTKIKECIIPKRKKKRFLFF